MNTDMSSWRRILGVGRSMGVNAACMLQTRFELLLVELQEERERCIRALLLVLVASMGAVLALASLTALCVYLLWPYSPVGALCFAVFAHLTLLSWAWTQLRDLRQSWKSFESTLDQMNKDRECLTGLLDGERGSNGRAGLAGAERGDGSVSGAV